MRTVLRKGLDFRIYRQLQYYRVGRIREFERSAGEIWLDINVRG